MGKHQKNALPVFQLADKLLYVVILKMDVFEGEPAAPSLKFFHQRKGKGDDVP